MLNRTAKLFGCAIALVFLNAHAGDDRKYPAYDFQPEVIYLDPDVAKALKAEQEDSKYPAAYFEPKVIVSPEVGATAQHEPHEIDPNYPAAYFEPEVIYQDPDLMGN